MLSMIIRKFKKVLLGLIMSVLITSMFSGKDIESSSEEYINCYVEYPTVIALDYGHYVGEPGKRSPADENGFEKQEILYNATIGRLVKEKIMEKTNGKVVVYETNPDLNRTDRSGRAVSAKQHGADMLISLHMDAVDCSGQWQNRVNGTHVIVSENCSKDVYDMAQSMIDKYSDDMQFKKLADNGVSQRGTDVGIIWKGDQLGMPSFLIEMNFMDNPEVAKNFGSKAYMDKVAESLADAILMNCGY